MPQLFEIVLFALLACYLIFRLWSVLGQNTPTDEERQNYKKQLDDSGNSPNFSPSIKTENPSTTAEPFYLSLPYGIKEGLRRIQQEDPLFTIEGFMEGAEEAYELILEEFSKGNKEDLKNLLTQEVYENFKKVIENRETMGQKIEIQIEKMSRIDIEGVDLTDSIARITVRYRSYQILCTYDQQDNCIDNPAKIAKPITDIWTFERDCHSDNPNWFLCATRTESY